ncbi:acyl carrier protein [Nocardia paucivorans]|uniref:acyl carrier protein n=1 Tax=Nocardia paucivorans TaxID=114259 RepID=UPI0002D2DE84|nr:acyl carrier protein [Nocardia paucivorans]
MTERFTIQTLREILGEHVGVDIAPGELAAADRLTMEELGVDSLAVFEIQSVVQGDFGVTLPAALLEMTGAQVVRYVDRYVNGEAA